MMKMTRRCSTNQYRSVFLDEPRGQGDGSRHQDDNIAVVHRNRDERSRDVPYEVEVNRRYPKEGQAASPLDVAELRT